MIKIKRTEVHRIKDNDLFYLLNQFEFDGYYSTCMYQPRGVCRISQGGGAQL